MTFTRRSFLQRACATAAALACGAPPAFTADAERPNILFIYTDDQAVWSIAGLGHENPVTPHLDLFFDESVRCTNAFVTTPVCSPSRVGLLASRYGTEVGITDWINPRGGEHQRNEAELGLEPTLPTWVRQLQGAGYRTGLVGKWHLGTQDRYHPSHFGYDYFAGFRPGGAPVENPPLEVDGEVREVPGMTMDVLTDLAEDFIRGARQPFALSLHYRAPHSPWLPVAEEDAAAYADRELTLPDPDFPDLDTERAERMLREYLMSVTGVDRNVGRLLGLLAELGLEENTIVVFTSDHGYHIGHNGIVHKGNGGWITNAVRGIPGHHPQGRRSNMFDLSLRVPLAVRWPGVLTPGEVTETVSNLDWYPTLLAMAGLEPEPDATIHGRNFLPLLQGESVPWDNDLYGEYSQHHYVETDLRMYRTPEWKLVRDFRNPGRDELYHLAADPEERVNLFYAREHYPVRERLETALRARMEALRDPVLDAAP